MRFNNFHVRRKFSSRSADENARSHFALGVLCKRAYIIIAFSILLIAPTASAQIIDEIINSTNELERPFAIAVDEGFNVYVAGWQSNNAFSITPGGVVTEIISDATHTLTNPEAIAFDSDGNVFVAGWASNNVFKIASGGAITEIIDWVNVTAPRALAVDGEGNVYIAGQNSHNVLKVTPAGGITEIINNSGDGSNSLTEPYAVAVDSENNVYVVGNGSDNAFKITPGGTKTQIISSALHNLTDPRGIAVDRAGNVYVAGYLSDTAFRITPGGGVTEIINSAGDGSATLSRPWGVATDDIGNVYVTGSNSDNVFKISSSGAVSKIIDSNGSGPSDQLDGPRAVAAHREGRVFVAGGNTGSDNAFEIQLNLFVDTDAPGANDGTSWTDAYTSLQDAIGDALSSNGVVHSIWVAAGTYQPDIGVSQTPGSHVETFQLVNDVALYGGFAGTETSVIQRDFSTNETILSGDLSGNDSFVACTSDAECGSNGGHCADNGFCIIPDNNSENSFHVVTGSGTISTAVLDGFTISSGSADVGCCADDRGAGISNIIGSPTISNCVIQNCWAVNIGGGMYNLSGSSPTVTNCVFRRNGAGNSGAGVYNLQSADGNFVNCRFLHNYADLSGGGVINESSVPLFANCLFHANGGGGGGGMYNWNVAAPQVVNCTFVGNTAIGFGGGMFNDGTATVVNNSIFWGNTDTNGMGESAQIAGAGPSVNYSVVMSGWTGAGGTGNSALDPLFADVDGADGIAGNDDDNLSLSAGSPAIDAGNNNALPLDSFDLDDDVDTSETLPLDLAGAPRRLNDAPIDPDPGNAGALGSPVVDMGAFEFVSGVLLVDDSGIGNDDGTSWADAFPSLQDALVAADMANADADSFNDVTQLWVAEGMYRPDDGTNTSATFQLRNGVALLGGFVAGNTSPNQRNVELNETILTGDLAGDDALVACGNDSPACDANGQFCADDGFCITPTENTDNSCHVVTGSGNDASAVLDGFTVTAGFAKPGCPDDFGGGIYVQTGSPTIVNCTIKRNMAEAAGGGMYSHVNSAPTLRDSSFLYNRSNRIGGGMLNIESSSPTLTGCLFQENFSGEQGGGLNTKDGDTTIVNCDFVGNRAGTDGGATYIQGELTPVQFAATNCRFFGNSAGTSGGAILFLQDVSGSLVNNLFVGNQSNNSGGAIHRSNAGAGTISLSNCTLTLNDALISGGGINNSQGTFQVVNSIVWGNIGEQVSGTVDIEYSIVEGGWPGRGMTVLDEDPLFVDADGLDNLAGTVDDDARVRSGSPAVDAGDRTAVPADTADLDADGDTSEAVPIDLFDSSRFINDLLTEDTGVGMTPIVDIGVHEFFRDCNGNGIPDSVDLLQGTSLDLDFNDIPDECVVFDGDCDSDADPANDNDWSCPENWDGDVVPNNDGPDHYAVTIAAEEVDLDIPATIDSLAILDGASLNVACDDNDPQCAVGSNLTVVREAGLRIFGNLQDQIPSTMLVDSPRTITVRVDGGPEGPVVIGPGGALLTSAGQLGGTSASLDAGSLEIQGGFMPGVAFITDDVGIEIGHEITLVSAHPGSRPPCLSVLGSASVGAGTNFNIQGNVDLLVNSIQPVEVGGDFRNESTDPTTFSWESGDLLLDGLSGTSQQRFEAAGVDVGAVALGATDNFAMRAITIGSSANVVMEDSFDNDDDGQSSCGEAVYVDTLVLEAGSQLKIDNCRVYYHSLIDNGGTVTFNGCGALVQFDFVLPPAPMDDGLGACAVADDCPGQSICADGVCYLPRGRYLSFSPTSNNNLVAYSILLPDGRTGWVGEPAPVDWQGIDAAWSSLVVESPVFRDWSGQGEVLVRGCVIAPGQTYELRATSDNSEFTEPLVIGTAIAPLTGSWADVVGSFDSQTQSWSPPNGFVNFNDIDAAVKKFQTVPTAPHVSVIDLHPQWANYFVNFSDIDMIIKGFQGVAYPVPLSDCQTIANCPMGPAAPCLP